jgi:hypothetical protein
VEPGLSAQQVSTDTAAITAKTAPTQKNLFTTPSHYFEN